MATEGPASDRDLLRRAQRDDVAALDELVRRMQPLVRRIARRRLDNRSDLEDRIQEGNLGLIEAVRTFDPAKGEFEPHATFWVGKFIRRFSAANHTIVRRPPHVGWGDMPTFHPSGHEMIDSIPTVEDFSGAIARAIVLDDALRKLHPFECWLLCERYGLARPDCLDRKSYPESPPADDAAGSRWSRHQRTVKDLAVQCGLSAYRINGAIESAMANLRRALGDDASAVA